METAAPAAPEAGASPSPWPTQPRRPGGLFFQTTEEAPPAPRSSPETDPAAAGEQLDESGSSGDDWLSDESDPEQSDESPTSSRSAEKLKPLGKAALKATTIQAVLIGSGMAHRLAARTEGQRAVGLYLADEEDAENVADPLSSILHRHGGIAGGAMNPDTADALAMMFGLAGYASKQIVRLQQSREVDVHLAAGGTLDGLGG